MLKRSHFINIFNERYGFAMGDETYTLAVMLSYRASRNSLRQ